VPRGTRKIWRALEWLPVGEAAMDRALEVQRLLAQHRANGRRRPIPDLIIAATAELHGAEVLHADSDYDLIAEVTGQPMRRLLDPGRA
jgi:predicted nucleic acid-binding protein